MTRCCIPAMKKYLIKLSEEWDVVYYSTVWSYGGEVRCKQYIFIKENLLRKLLVSSTVSLKIYIGHKVIVVVTEYSGFPKNKGDVVFGSHHIFSFTNSSPPATFGSVHYYIPPKSPTKKKQPKKNLDGVQKSTEPLGQLKLSSKIFHFSSSSPIPLHNSNLPPTFSSLPLNFLDQSNSRGWIASPFFMLITELLQIKFRGVFHPWLFTRGKCWKSRFTVASCQLPNLESVVAQTRRGKRWLWVSAWGI